MLSYNDVIWKVTGTRDKLHRIWREAAVESATSLAWFIRTLVLLVVSTQLLLCLVTHLYPAHEILEWWKVHIPVLWLQDPDFTGRHQGSAVWGFCSPHRCRKLVMQCWEVLPSAGTAQSIPRRAISPPQVPAPQLSSCWAPVIQLTSWELMSRLEALLCTERN